MTHHDKYFVELMVQARPIAETAYPIQNVFDDHWLYGFDAAQGLFLILPAQITIDEIACALATRQIESDARKAHRMTQDMVTRLEDLPPPTETVQ